MNRVLNWACGALCGGALFAIMLLTFLDVSGRKFLSHSIPGSLELTELFMVVVIFAGLPLVSFKREHVTFDSLDSRIPKSLQRVQQAVINLLCGLALLGLAWLMWQTGVQIGGFGESTAQLKISKAPFIQAMGVACALTAFVHFYLVVKPGSTEEPDNVATGATT
jgi:TRAP-type transport system small permease protein